MHGRSDYRPLRRRDHARPRCARPLRKLDPAHALPQPGDVRHRGRGRAVDPALPARCSSPAAATEPSSARSPPGSGSPSTSPTSPRPWPKAGARRAPTRCARPRRETPAKRLASRDGADDFELVSSRSLTVGDVVLVEAGDIDPGRRRGHRGRRVGRRVGDHRRVGAGHPRGRRRPLRRHRRHAASSPTGSRCGSRRKPGESFLDRMIALVEGAERQKTPNEIALNILLVGMTIIFLIVVATLEPFVIYSGAFVPVVFLVALLVTLIPTTIGGLLVGDRHRRHGPAGEGQRHRQVRPRGRGGGRRRHAAPRQDRHHHLRQPHGRCVRAAARHRPATNWSRPPCLPRSRTRRRRASRSSSSPASTVCIAAMPDVAACHPVLRPTRAFPAPTSRTARSSAKAPSTPILAWCELGEFAPLTAHHRGDRPHRRHAAGGCTRQATPRRHPPQGHRQARHPRRASPSCAAWASAR